MVSSSSDKSNLRLRISATLLETPGICWLYTQQLLVSMICANFRDAMNSGKFLDGSTLALCNQLTNDELSPRLRKHSSNRAVCESNVCQIVIMEARNSKLLFLFFIVPWNSGGIGRRHAFPSRSNPPIPVGQASDHHTNDGRQ
jgi:hypothetical protein